MSSTTSGASAAVDAAVSFLQTKVSTTPTVGIVLGSGLKGLAESVEDRTSVPYDEIPGFPVPTVAGHGGSLLFGRLGRTNVVCQSGRFHLYEGFDAGTVVLPIRLFHQLGADTLVVTNAAGGLNRTMAPPQLMLITDQINLTLRSVLAGPVITPELRFPDMSSAYDVDLRKLATSVARMNRIDLEPGVYAGVLGPSYETPAEIRMLERMGADAIGMSTVAEVITARSRGMRVLGISTITNLAAGMSPTPLSHDEVLEAGRRASAALTKLVTGVLEEFD